MAQPRRRGREVPAESAAAPAGGSEYPPIWSGYSDAPHEMPLAGYASLLGAYMVVFGGLLGRGVRQGLPERVGLSDIVLFGVATHKIGRIVTKDWVTSPLRAPFTEYAGSTGGGEVSERSRGTGLRRAVGDLLTCPWCIAPWVAGGLYSAFVTNPRVARLAGAMFTSVAISDALQHAYSGLKRSRN